MQHLHPSQFHHYHQTLEQANNTSRWILGGVCLSVAMAIASPIPQIKFGVSGLGLAGCIAARQCRKTAIATDRLLRDVGDISHTAFQRVLLEQMLEKQLPPADWGAAELDKQLPPGPVEFPIEDLAMRMAETTRDPSNGGSVLIACPKRTGKSNLLRAAIAATARLHGGNVEFLVFDGKGGESFCGLESTPNYHYSGDVDVIPHVLARLNSLKPRLKQATGFPTVPVLDEYNNTRAAAKLYDKLNSRENKFKIAELLSASTYERITKGGSKLVCDWITSHEADVSAIDLSLSLQQSLNYIVLGRGNLMGAIYAAVAGRRPIIDDDLIREKLKAQFEQWRQQNGADGSRVIALTNIGGDWRLVILPRYPDQQQPVQSLILDAELEEEEQEDPELESDLQLWQQCEGKITRFAMAKYGSDAGAAFRKAQRRVEELKQFVDS